MDDDDETYIPSSDGRITLALPIQIAKPYNSNSNSSYVAVSAGREDCWSEEATAVLVNAWGERYMELSRGNLKQQHWKQVADIVSESEFMRTPKTDVQCKNRIDTVKKKYKAEKAKIAASGGRFVSNWRFYDQIDGLIGPSLVNKEVVPVAVRSSLRTVKRPKLEDWESDNSSDGLPPVSYNKRMKANTTPNFNNNIINNRSVSVNYNNNSNKNNGNLNVRRGSGKDSMGELTESIMKLGEAYEQAEIAKLQQVFEMEKQRMKFAKEMEMQRMQFFMKMQMEILQIRNNAEEEEDGNNDRGALNESNGVHVNNGNNNDVAVDDDDGDNNVSDSGN